MKLILAADEPAALVQSMPEQDLYFLVNDIGFEDALPLLALSSTRQWEYFLDLETWRRDRLDTSATWRWFDLLFRANTRRTIKWLMKEKIDLLELFLCNNIEVKIREHDQDPSDLGDDYTTLDNIFYVRISGPLAAAESELGDIEKENHRDFLLNLMERIADFDYIAYQKILLELVSVLPTESEEETYRLRNVRLAEKGFLPFEEAVGVYQPLKPAQLAQSKRDGVSRKPAVTGVPASQYPAILLQDGSAFADGLAGIDSQAVWQQLQTEFAGLCNRIAAADFMRVNSREALKTIVEKASGYLSIGLHILRGSPPADEQPPGNRFAELVQHHLLADIFRIGYSRALDLKWRTQKWMDMAWFARQGLSLTFWDEEKLGVLGGLLVKKPLFFDNYRTGRMYREFGSVEDLRMSEAILDDIIAIDNLFSLLDFRLDSLAGRRFLTFKNLLLTFWVLDRIGSGNTLRFLQLGEFREFFRGLWRSDTKEPQIKAEMKSSFLNWLSRRSGLDDFEIVGKLGSALESLFADIEDQCGRVDAADLNPKYIQLFLLER